MNFLKQIWDDMLKHKKGLMIGGLSGLVATIYLASTGANLMFAVASPGIVDNFIGAGQSLSQVALTKVGIMLVSIGMTVGYIAESM